jgi:hypothetical protein
LGGGNPVTLLSGVAFASIAVDSTSLYVGSLSAVLRVPLAGGNPVTLVPRRDNIGGLVADLTNLYWTTTTSHTVLSLPLAGGSPVQLYSSPSGGFANALAVDATSVYFTDWDGTVTKVPLAGGSPVTLASGQVSPGAIAVDSTSVYWLDSPINGDPSSLMKVTPK